VKIKIIAAIVLSVTFCLPATAESETPREGTKLILLGTAGGPSTKKNRSQPASAIVVNGDIYIVDTGDGVARQLTLAGLSVTDIRSIFITHNHADHMADYGTLLLRSWLTGRRDVIQTFGPPPLEKITAHYLDYMRWDIDLKVSDEGRPPLDQLIDAHDIETDGVIYSDENVTVTVFTVKHGAAKPAYGYRFDTADKSIVFSGDTTPNDNVIKAAKGVDILVHEVVSVASIDAMIARVAPGNDALRRHILNNHTNTGEVGEIASEAGVKLLVLSHFGGAGDPDFDRPEVWAAAVRKTYSGPLIVGEDLTVIE
jgi:ribonuclease BN (tRNA processing enzyme)